MANTTAGLIRDRIITVITGLTPTLHSSDAFRVYLEELDVPFEEWIAKNPQLRRFSVRDAGSYSPPVVSNSDVVRREVTFEILVAYPNTNQYGSDASRTMDDVIEQDMNQIENAVGLHGSANFTAPYADACWSSGETSRIVDESVTLLSIVQRMEFSRSTS
jgi:hypothetical protein